MNRKSKQILFVVAIILILALVFFLILKVFTMSIHSCTSQPLTFGAKQVEDRVDRDVICTCTFLNEPTTTYIIFNSTHVNWLNN